MCVRGNCYKRAVKTYNATDGVSRCRKTPHGATLRGGLLRPLCLRASEFIVRRRRRRRYIVSDGIIGNIIFSL